MMNTVSFLLEAKNTILPVKLDAEQPQSAGFISPERECCHYLMSIIFM